MRKIYLVLIALGLPGFVFFWYAIFTSAGLSLHTTNTAAVSLSRGPYEPPPDIRQYVFLLKDKPTGDMTASFLAANLLQRLEDGGGIIQPTDDVERVSQELNTISAPVEQTINEPVDNNDDEPLPDPEPFDNVVLTGSQIAQATTERERLVTLQNSLKSRIAAEVELTCYDDLDTFTPDTDDVDAPSPEGNPDCLHFTASFQRYTNAVVALLTPGQKSLIESAFNSGQLPEVGSFFEAPKFEPSLPESTKKIGATNVWPLLDKNVPAHVITGYNRTIAVIDTGFDYTHPMLGSCTDSQVTHNTCAKFAGTKRNPQGWLGSYNFGDNNYSLKDKNGHGTHVAAIAAGSKMSLNSGFIQGVAPEAKIYGFKVADKTGEIGWTAIQRALDRAGDMRGDGDIVQDDHVDVVNLSIGGSCSGSYSTYCGPYDEISNSIKRTVENGVIVVVSAGNDGPALYSVVSPAVSPSAISVANYNRYTNMIDSSSSRGPVVIGATGETVISPTISAPGGLDICSAKSKEITAQYFCYSRSNLIPLSGTSMAAPHVAGEALLIKQYHPTWTPDMVRTVIQSKSTGINQPIYMAGYGLANVTAAIKYKGSPGTAIITTNKTITHSTTKVPIYGTATAPTGRFKRWDLYVKAGTNTAAGGTWTLVKGSTSAIRSNAKLADLTVSSFPAGLVYTKLIVTNNVGGQVWTLGVINRK